MQKKMLFALVILLVASLACNAINDLPIFSTPTQEPNQILYQDDFSNSETGWPRLTDADGIVDYDSGFYRIRVDTVGSDQSGMDIWANPGQNLEGDIRVEVDATRINGPDENDMGVLCRYTKTVDTYNFYYFVITSDGYAVIGKMKNSSAKFISGLEMISSTAIQKNATNHIRADCVGEKLTLYVNDKLVATASDDEFTGGDIGLIAGTFGTPGVDIHFDNFVVTKP